MYKKLFCLLVLSLLFTKTALAGGFNLKSIGPVNTDGRQISHWWYAGLTPVMSGEAVAGNTVTVSIDGVETAATVTDSTWTYNPGALAAGDHAIILTSGGSTISFTLTLGAENVDWAAVGSGSAQTLPTVGVILPTIMLMGSSGLFFLVAKKLI